MKLLTDYTIQYFYPHITSHDITKYLDLSKARRPKQEQKRVNVDFPVWMIHSLDKEAKRLGVPRQSLIKVLVAEHYQNIHA